MLYVQFKVNFKTDDCLFLLLIVCKERNDLITKGWPQIKVDPDVLLIDGLLNKTDRWKIQRRFVILVHTTLLSNTTINWLISMETMIWQQVTFITNISKRELMCTEGRLSCLCPRALALAISQTALPKLYLSGLYWWLKFEIFVLIYLIYCFIILYLL